jgi:hypothetical protein
VAGGEKVNRAIAFYQVLHEAAEALTPEGGQPCARVEGLLSSTEHSDLLALCTSRAAAGKDEPLTGREPGCAALLPFRARLGLVMERVASRVLEVNVAAVAGLRSRTRLDPVPVRGSASDRSMCRRCDNPDRNGRAMALVYAATPEGAVMDLILTRAGQGGTPINLRGNDVLVYWADCEVFVAKVGKQAAGSCLLTTFYSDTKAAAQAYGRCEVQPDGVVAPQAQSDWLSAYLEAGHPLQPLSEGPPSWQPLDLACDDLGALSSLEGEVPPHDIALVEGGAKVRVTVWLAGVGSSGELDLDVEGTKFVLEAGPYRLDLKLEFGLDDEGVVAKFNKSTQILFVHVPIALG